MNPNNYLLLAAILFTIGAYGVLVRRNAIIVFLSVELMLNAANLAFVAAARNTGTLDGLVAAFLVMPRCHLPQVSMKSRTLQSTHRTLRIAIAQLNYQGQRPQLKKLPGLLAKIQEQLALPMLA